MSRPLYCKCGGLIVTLPPKEVKTGKFSKFNLFEKATQKQPNRYICLKCGRTYK